MGSLNAVASLAKLQLTASSVGEAAAPPLEEESSPSLRGSAGSAGASGAAPSGASGAGDDVDALLRQLNPHAGSRTDVSAALKEVANVQKLLPLVGLPGRGGAAQ